MTFKANDIVLFQGDSVTDCGRDRNQLASWGTGYAMMAASWYSATYPQQNVQFINKGISGNRVKDLQARWQEDCLDLKPNWVSILIGINDCWRRYDRNDPTSVEEYKSGYRILLEQIKDQLDAGIIICEPFVLPVPADRIQWREDLDPKIQAARELAREFGAIYVPLDGLFAQASMKAPAAKWMADGVHPTPMGHAMIAQSWLNAIDR